MSNQADQQYRDGAKLAARAALHDKYGPRNSLADIPAAVTPSRGSAVLEVGCGSGRFWRSATAWPADLALTLVDLSPGMVGEAQATLHDIGRWTDLTTQVADVCALPFAEASFDLVLALHMLYHAADPDQATVEIARVLRPGGVAIASTNGKDSLGAIMELGQAAFGGARGDAHLGGFSLESGEAIMRRHFASVEVRRTADRLLVTDPADVVAYLTSFPPGDAAPPPVLKRLRAITEAAFEAGGGVLEVVRDAGYLLARK
jgi:SAM-dependent methyltransferase